MNIWAPNQVYFRPTDPFKIAPRLQILIKDLTLLSQEPEKPEYRATFQRLEWLIAGQLGCENDAQTAKTIVSLLFTVVINNERTKPEGLPRAAAQLADAILTIIPDTMRDWTRPGDATNRGKPLFRQLILERARAHLQLPSLPHRRESPWRPERMTIDTKSDRPVLISMLSHSGRLQLSEFIGELAIKKLLPTVVVYEYILKLLHSTSVPSPNRSELEAVCRLLQTAESIIHSLAWSGSFYNALEMVRRRAGPNLDAPLRVLLLETIWRGRQVGKKSHENLRDEFQRFVKASQPRSPTIVHATPASSPWPSPSPPPHATISGSPQRVRTSAPAGPSAPQPSFVSTRIISMQLVSTERESPSNVIPIQNQPQGESPPSSYENPFRKRAEQRQGLTTEQAAKRQTQNSLTDKNALADCSDIYHELLECLKGELPKQTPVHPAFVSNPFEHFSDCSLCYERAGDYVLFPCGHAGMCGVCADKMVNCPQCRKFVMGRTKIYRS